MYKPFYFVWTVQTYPYTLFLRFDISAWDFVFQNSKPSWIFNIFMDAFKGFWNLPSAAFKAIPFSFFWCHQMLNLWLEFGQKEIINWFMVQFEKLHKMHYTNIAFRYDFFFVRWKIPRLEGWMKMIKDLLKQVPITGYSFWWPRNDEKLLEIHTFIFFW